MAAKTDPFAAPRRLSDAAPASDLTPLEDLAGRDLLLLSFDTVTSSRFGDERTGYRCILKETDGSDVHTAMLFGVVTTAQLAKIDSNDLPMLVKLEKQGRAWVIV